MKHSSHAADSTSIREMRTVLETLRHDLDPSSLKKINELSKKISQEVSSDKVLSTASKMAQSLVGYMISKGSDAHSDALTMLRSVSVTMDDLANAVPPVSPNEKQARLANEIAKFNAFKSQIQPQKSSASPASQPLAELKAIILSLDWEISDNIISKLDTEVNRLKKMWPKSKTHQSFLQMFQSIGQYVKKNRANTHPGAISLLTSLCKSFDQVVIHPHFSDTQRQEILSREIQKFKQLKQVIATQQSRTSQENQGGSLMDDLIGTKSSSNLSPVDDLIEEIHMLQDEGGAPRASANAPAGPVNPDVKEVIPDRQKTQPLPEIESRLDAFFNEDEPMEAYSLGDSGDEVVPYQDTGSVSREDASERLNASARVDSSQQSPPQTVPDDGMVPFDFEDEFFEDTPEFSSELEGDAPEPEKRGVSSPPIDGALIEKIKSKTAQCMFDNDTTCLREIEPVVSQLMSDLERGTQGAFPTESQVLLKLFDAFQNPFPYLPADMIQTGVEGMVFCLDCLDKTAVSSDAQGGSDEFSLSHACSRYIDFQKSVLAVLAKGVDTKRSTAEATSISSGMDVAAAKGGEGDETDHAPEILTDGALEPSREPPKGFWGKLKRFFGGG